MPTIRGDHTQAGTGKVITYEVDYLRKADTAVWDAKVLLLGGRWFHLKGGTISGVGEGSVAPAVIQHLNAELNSLDMEKLNQG